MRCNKICFDQFARSRWATLLTKGHPVFRRPNKSYCVGDKKNQLIRDELYKIRIHVEHRNLRLQHDATQIATDVGIATMH